MSKGTKVAVESLVGGLGVDSISVQVDHEIEWPEAVEAQVFDATVEDAPSRPATADELEQINAALASDWKWRESVVAEVTREIRRHNDELTVSEHE